MLLGVVSVNDKPKLTQNLPVYFGKHLSENPLVQQLILQQLTEQDLSYLQRKLMTFCKNIIFHLTA